MTTPITGQGLNVCIPPDDELSSTSKKAAQNKVITEEFTNVSNAISQLETKADNAASVIINTASGDVASFSDGADGGKIKKIVGTIVTPEGGSGWTGVNIWQRGANLFTINPLRKIYRARTNGVGQVISDNYLSLFVYRIPKGTLYMQHPGTTTIYYGFSDNPNLNPGDTIESASNVRWGSEVTFQQNGYKYMYVTWSKEDSYPILLSLTPASSALLPIGAEGNQKYIDWSSVAGTVSNGTVTLNEDGSADVVNSDTGDTYHLTDVGSLSTLYGGNNIWIDTGAITECDYPADTKLYIDGLTEPDEDMIANANIASGKYFVVNNQLYLSTAAIAAGASIIPGTNCTATSLAEALNAINT